MSRFKVMLFDWGHTLVKVAREEDTWLACTQRTIDALADAGWSPPPNAATTLQEVFVAARSGLYTDPAHTELRLEDVLEDWIARCDTPRPSDAALGAAAEAFWQGWTTCLDNLDDAPSILRRVRESGIVTGLASNVAAPERYCLAQLHRLGLLEHLDMLTLSSVVGRRKPHEDFYDHVAQRMQVHLGALPDPQDVLFIGDSPPCDVAGPARLGWRTALLEHPEVNSPWAVSEYETCTPDYRWTHLEQVLTLLT